MSQTREVRTRFAPSPTGFLHVGGARTALFSYFYARAKGGKFILRIEDTDLERNKPEYEAEILESMKWLGMEWDEGPYYQTKRFDRYRELADRMLAEGTAYKCYCTPAELDAQRAKAEAAGKKPMYDRTWRPAAGKTLPPVPAGAPFVVRIKAPLEGEVVVDDAILGRVAFPAAELDDFILARSSGAPTYNFTVVVDDIDMRISHVVRAQEHLNNTPKQMIIMRALGWEPPVYAHVPLVLAPDKSKLSKRHGAVAVTNYRQEGYLEQAMVNYLARLGWSHGDQEIFSFEELCRVFDLGGCGNSGSVFDRTKLDWYNAHYIRALTQDEIVRRVKELYKVDFSPLLSTPSGQRLLSALAERAVRLNDFVTGAQWYLTEEPVRDPAAYETVLKPAKKELLIALTKKFEQQPESEWAADKLGALVKQTATENGAKMPELGKPARVLLTGGLAGPDLGLIVESLGKARTLARLARL
jgi:glutamyl-tRNA synthetase